MQDADESFEVLATILQRMRGVLLRPPDGVTRILVPCRDVHTFGMKALLDIAFVGTNGTVLEVHRAVGPSRRLRCKRAVMVAERFSREGAWLEVGQRMVLRPNACALSQAKGVATAPLAKARVRARVRVGPHVS